MKAQELVKPIFSVKNVTMDFKVAKKGFFSKKSTIRALNDEIGRASCRERV